MDNQKLVKSNKNQELGIAEDVIEIRLDEVAKEMKIPLADDVLMVLIEWIPLRNLPNVTLVNKRFWWYCDEELEGRKHTIQGLHLTRILPDSIKLKVTKITGIPGLLHPVPLAEVEPPTNFKLRDITLTHETWDEVMAFLEVSRRLFIGALFECFWNDQNVDFLGKYVEIFDSCSKITVWYANSSLTEQFLSKTQILNYNFLTLNQPNVDFDPTCLFNWLHTPTSDPNAKRQLFIGSSHFRYAVLPRIIERFSKDSKEHKFIARIGELHFPMAHHLRIENHQTGEVLYTRIDLQHWDLIRCSKEDEGTVEYERINENDIAKIEFQ